MFIYSLILPYTCYMICFLRFALHFSLEQMNDFFKTIKILLPFQDYLSFAFVVDQTE